MRDVADLVRGSVRTSIAPTPLYPFQRFASGTNAIPAKHAQLYADSESKGRPTIHEEHDGILYFHAYGPREADVHTLYNAVRWLDGFTSNGANGLYAVSYKLNTVTVTEDPDKSAHLTAIYNVRYYRRP